MKRQYKKAPAFRKIVRARFFFGWWVETSIMYPDSDWVTKVWFPTRKGAERFADAD